MTDTIHDTAPTEVPPAVVEAAEAVRERTPDGAPRFSLLELVEHALKTERFRLKVATDDAANAWQELDKALADQGYSTDAIAQLERTRAQLVADDVDAAHATEVHA